MICQGRRGQATGRRQGAILAEGDWRGGAVRHCTSIKGHSDVDRMDEADTSACFLSRGSSRLLLQIPFCPLVLFAYLLFPTLVLILLAFVSHCLSPFAVVPYLSGAAPEYDAACVVVEKVSRPHRQPSGAPVPCRLHGFVGSDVFK